MTTKISVITRRSTTLCFCSAKREMWLEEFRCTVDSCATAIKYYFSLASHYGRVLVVCWTSDVHEVYPSLQAINREKTRRLMFQFFQNRRQMHPLLDKREICWLSGRAHRSMVVRQSVADIPRLHGAEDRWCSLNRRQVVVALGRDRLNLVGGS